MFQACMVDLFSLGELDSPRLDRGLAALLFPKSTNGDRIFHQHSIEFTVCGAFFWVLHVGQAFYRWFCSKTLLLDRSLSKTAAKF